MMDRGIDSWSNASLFVECQIRKLSEQENESSLMFSLRCNYLSMNGRYIVDRIVKTLLTMSKSCLFIYLFQGPTTLHLQFLYLFFQLTLRNSRIRWYLLSDIYFHFRFYEISWIWNISELLINKQGSWYRWRIILSISLIKV